MDNLKQAVQAQIDNIQKKTGRTFAELSAMVTDSGLTQHSRLREMFMRELNLTYGDANALVHAILQSDGTRAAEAKDLSADAVLDEIYSGPKAGLRPIHAALMAEIVTFGKFEQGSGSRCAPARTAQRHDVQLCRARYRSGTGRRKPGRVDQESV
jgi:hypothetical protein